MYKAIVSTRSMANFFCKNLSVLDRYMASINSDTLEFNNYIKLN